MSDTTDQLIESAAALPAKYELDGEKIEARPIADVIKASEYVNKKRRARNPFSALKGVQFSTEGPER